MKHIIIRGGRRLEGVLPVQGAKNSVLPVLAATILHPGVTVLRGCPRLSDVEAAESGLDIDTLVREAVDGVERIWIDLEG